MSPTLTAKSLAEPGVAGLLRPLPAPNSVSGLGVLEQAATASASKIAPVKRVVAFRHVDSSILVPFQTWFGRPATENQAAPSLRRSFVQKCDRALCPQKPRPAGKWQYRGSRFPHNAHAPGIASPHGFRLRAPAQAIGAASRDAAPILCSTAYRPTGPHLASGLARTHTCRQRCCYRVKRDGSNDCRESSGAQVRHHSSTNAGPLQRTAFSATGRSAPAPSFMGLYSSRRHAPRATAATTTASTTMLFTFIVFSPTDFGNRTYVATEGSRSDQERSAFSRGFPPRLMRKCHFTCAHPPTLPAAVGPPSRCTDATRLRPTRHIARVRLSPRKGTCNFGNQRRSGDQAGSEPNAGVGIWRSL